MKEEKKAMSAFKKLTIFLLIILTIFGAINLSWYLLKYRPYKKLAQNFKKSEMFLEIDSRHYEMNKDKYYFTIKMPSYLGFEGGFCRVYTENEFTETIGDEEVKKENTEITGYTLYYWPSILGDDEYGIEFEMGEDFVQLNITKELEYIPEENESQHELREHKKLIDDNKEDIKAIMDEANSVWG